MKQKHPSKRKIWNYLLAYGAFFIMTLFASYDTVYSIPSGYVEYIDVTAKIDHQDDFVMKGNQWWWYHYGSFSAPEVHEGITPTVIDSPYLAAPQSFLSCWPGVCPTPVSYNPGVANSDPNIVLGLPPIQDVLDLSSPLWIEQLSGRTTISLLLSPSPPDYTLKLETDSVIHTGYQASSLISTIVFLYFSKKTAISETKRSKSER